jgi:signal peptidase I
MNDKKLTIKQTIVDNLKSIIIALIIALLIRSFIFQAFFIPSGSMKPNLLEGDYVLVTKYNYGYSNYSLPFGLPLLPSSRIFYTQPNRGDVIVFKFRGDNSTDYVKRLIGLPGDKIQVINSIVYINNKALKREFIKEEKIDGITYLAYREYMDDVSKSYIIWQVKGANHPNSLFFGPKILGKDEFFAMGDNRDMSKDSRFAEVSTIEKSNLVGKGGLIFFSINGSFIEVWKWFTEIRWHRIFNLIK